MCTGESALNLTLLTITVKASENFRTLGLNTIKPALYNVKGTLSKNHETFGLSHMEKGFDLWIKGTDRVVWMKKTGGIKSRDTVHLTQNNQLLYVTCH
jgi:hypothetical protein